MAQDKNSKAYLRTALAGLSGVTAAMIVHPIDTMKIRMQLQGELETAGKPKRHRTIMHAAYSSYLKEGLHGPYKGLSASLARESSYTTIRLGLYEPYKQMLGAKEGVKVPFYIQACAGMLSGLTGSALANPTDLVKVRMQAWEAEPVPKLRWHVSQIY